jgi:hypothetical protein
LAVACWSGTPLLGMLTYNATVLLYLAFRAPPAVSAASAVAGRRRAVLTALLARDQREARLQKT